MSGAMLALRSRRSAAGRAAPARRSMEPGAPAGDGYDGAVDLESLRQVQSVALFVADWCGVAR